MGTTGISTNSSSSQSRGVSPAETVSSSCQFSVQSHTLKLHPLSNLKSSSCLLFFSVFSSVFVLSNFPPCCFNAVFVCALELGVGVTGSWQLSSAFRALIETYCQSDKHICMIVLFKVLVLSSVFHCPVDLPSTTPVRKR